MQCSSNALDSYTKTNAFWSRLRSFSRPWASSARVLSSLPSMWNARALHVDPGLVVRLLRNGLAVQLQRVGHAALDHGHRGPHALPRVVPQVVLHVILEPDG